MPPLRFLHAAGLDPDAVLTGPPAGFEDRFKAAPIAAVARLVSQAIEREVNFLLVSPAPAADGPSPAAEAALRSEFDRLFERGIAVFLAVPTHSSGWERLAGRASNVVLLVPGSFAPVADRDGHPAGVLRCVEQPTWVSQASMPGPDDSLDLAVAPALSIGDLEGGDPLGHDYLAVGLGPRQTVNYAAGIAHTTGPLQATEAAETGPRGATLVTIDEAGRVATEFVPTATVRFETPTIPSEPNDVIEDVALRMADWLERRKPEPGETTWVVRWTIDESRELRDSLATASARADLLGLLPDLIGDVSIVHEMADRRHPARPAEDVRRPAQDGAFTPAQDDAFAVKFAAALEARKAALADLGGRLALVGVPSDAPHGDRLARLLGSVDATAVLAGARRAGLAVTAAAIEPD